MPSQLHPTLRHRLRAVVPLTSGPLYCHWHATACSVMGGCRGASRARVSVCPSRAPHADTASAPKFRRVSRKM